MSFDISTDETNEENLEIWKLLSLFWHWAWLIALVAIVAAAVAYLVSMKLTPYYESSTTLLVNEAPATKTTDYNSVMMSEQLTSTYSQMIAKDTILTEVINQLSLVMTTEELGKRVTVTPVRDSQLIQVSVETTDSQLSAEIANTIASVFSIRIQEIQSQRFAQSKASLEQQLADIETQISSYEVQQGDTISQEERDRLEVKVSQYREIYANLLQSYESVRLSEAQSVSSVVQVETARSDPKAVKPKTAQNVLLAALAGVLVAAGAVGARETLDDTVKSPDDIHRKFGVPVLGVINHLKGMNGYPITEEEPHSPTAEAYRTLRTNVEYASVDKPVRTLMVTSAEPGEGKTTTITNLAIVFAQSGKQVTVVDCDLRHPRTHISFRLNNRKGISNLFAQPSTMMDGARQPSSVENLWVVTAGQLPPNPAELLGSQKMKLILQALLQQADLVMVDTPPTLAVTDAAVLASSMDGVLIVVKPGKTRENALMQTIKQLKQVRANILGVVLNDVNPTGSAYGYHYKYYRNYAAYQKYYGQKSKKGKKGGTGK